MYEGHDIIATLIQDQNIILNSKQIHADTYNRALMNNPSKRRAFLQGCALAMGSSLVPRLHQKATARDSLDHDRSQRFSVSTYSFWQFRGPKVPIETCIDHAARMNFDGLEILEMQMTDSSNSYIQQLKRRAHSQGLALCGFSTHQGFVSPDSTRRQDNIKKTIASIEQAYRLGIPTMRINTGRWGTIKSFDALMANRGIEPRLEGYTDDDAYKWVIQSIEECLPVAEKCGVVLGLENHWGLGRTAAGVLKIIGAIKSPWLQATLDTGNFLEDMYQQMKALAPAACFVQAKTYNGGGTWYTLDIDYPQVATILHDAGYRGWVSLEFEGKDDPLIAIPKNLERLRHTFDRQ